MAVRVVLEDTPVIKVTGGSTSTVSSPVSSVNVVNVSQSSQLVSVPTPSKSTVEISSIASSDVKVDVPEVRPFKVIIYQGPKGDPGVSAEGSSVLTSDLVVTNGVGESDIGDVYLAYTDLEVIIRDMLSQYPDPDVQIVFANFVDPSNGEPYESNKFEIGDQISLNSLLLSSKDMENMFPGSNISFSITSPISSSEYISVFPQLVSPQGGWGYFPETTTVDVYVSNNNSLNYSTLGEKKIKAIYLILDNPENVYSATSVEKEYSFFIGKKIRCFTSTARDPRGTNFNSYADYNLYSQNENLLSTLFDTDPNEVQFEYVITDFSSDKQEVIVTFSGESQEVSDKNRYLIIEVPEDFVIDESAATTSGSGVYSLNDSIVYLGNQYQSGELYTRNSLPVKYYRINISGSLNDKIKLDLQIKLDN